MSNQSSSKASEFDSVCQKKSVRTAMRADQWLSLLRELAAFDKSNESKAAFWQEMLVAAVIGAVIGVVLLIVTHRPAVLLLIVPAAVLLVVAIARCQGLKAKDLSNGFRLLLLPLLDAIREDFRAGRPLSIEIDFRGTVEEKVVRRGKVARPNSLSAEQTVYHDPWCRLSGQLAGGHRLRLSVTDDYFKTVRNYRSASGKSKSKTKWKKNTVVRAALTPDPSHKIHAGNLRPFAQAGKFKVQERKGRSIVVVSRKFKFKEKKEAAPPEGQVLTMLVALCAALGRERGEKHVG